MNLNSLKLILVDFNKPWWDVIWRQKWLAAFVFCTMLVRELFASLLPFLLVFTIEQGSWYIFAAVCCACIGLELNNALMSFMNGRFQLQCIHSVFYSAHHYLLMIDPQYHVKRSSGAILGKIQRAARGYEDVLDQITYEFAPVAISVLTMLIILSQYSLLLVLGVCACIGAIGVYCYYFIWIISQRLEQQSIKVDDDFKAISFESLAQVHLIRATFATEYMLRKLEDKINLNGNLERKVWLSYMVVFRTVGVTYACSVVMTLGFLLHSVQAGIMTLPFAIGLMLAYIQNTHKLLKILNPMRRFMRGLTAIKDLFAFMPTSGIQTISVLQDSQYAVHKDGSIAIVARDLGFKYELATIFDQHNFDITTDAQQINKLYGIIGPSGAGKTTLLSMLGGQLKPLSGTITINGIDIYGVGDATRRQLIALQGQTASSIKGTIRYNLLFGLPGDHGYTDEFIADVIRRVGLAQILTENQGLSTFLGEGALNISGGQRQRLNFAGLYLRARYYKPALILIDEPTSSLDEISEQAITTMIHELATHSVTLVIAHRLKTLKDAVGLIDLSLIAQSKTIELYCVEQLKERSAYYQRLLEGKVAL